MPLGIELRKEYKPEKEPHLENNLLIVDKARELTREAASDNWNRVNLAASKFHPDSQIIVIRTHRDVTSPLYEGLREHPLGKYPVATTINDFYPNGDPHTSIRDLSPEAKSVYIVASITEASDYCLVRRAAFTAKTTYNASCVTLIAPHLGWTRQDKNVSRHGYDPGEPINIAAELAGFRGILDRMILCEPHSLETLVAAAEADMASTSLTPCEDITKALIKMTGIDPEQAVVIGPDKGRNLAARRIAEFLGNGKSRYISFDKTRLSGSEVEVLTLTEQEKEFIKGKPAIAYDDVISSGSTLATIGTQLDGLTSSLSVGVAHVELIGKWKDYMLNKFPSLILGTDSRENIGNVEFSAGKVKIMSIENWIRNIIHADMEGVNFWEDRQFKKMILQEE